MNKMIPFLLAATVVAPLYLSTPVYAQSRDDIQRLEERVQEAKQRGNWGAAQDLEVQLNQARLQYQRNNGLGENNDRGFYQNNGYQYNNGQNNGYYNRNNQNVNWNNGRYNNNRNRNRQIWQQQQQRGYYDQNGRWRNN